MKSCLAQMLLGPFADSLQLACCALLACLAAALPYVWLAEKGVRPLRALLGTLRGLAGGLVLAALLAGGTIAGGSKLRAPAAAPASAPVVRVANAVPAPSLRALGLDDPRLPPRPLEVD